MPKIAGAPHDKYSISSGSPGNYWGWAHNLTDAKLVGTRIAKKEMWRGKWNVMWLCVEIHVGGPAYYKSTGWKMYVPVSGSGKRSTYILDELKRRHGVKPFVWTKK
jgi:hypothetical protein